MPVDSKALPAGIKTLWSAIKRPATIALLVYTSYLALMMLVAMPLLNWLAPRIYHEQTGRELRFDNIVINPFKLSVSVYSPASDNPDSSQFWSAELLRADLSLASLWRWHLVLDELWLTGLDLQVDQTAKDRYNFSDILDYRAARAEPEPPETEQAPFKISIDWLLFSAKHLGLRAPHLGEPLAAELDDLTLTVQDFTTVPPKEYAPPADALPTAASSHIELGLGRLDFKSLRKQDPYATQLMGLKLTLDEFTTIAEPGHPYRLEAEADGGRLRWQGELSLAAGHSQGRLQLDNIDLLPVWRYLKPQLHFNADSARLDLSGDYRVNWRGKLDYGIDNGHAALREVKLQARDDEQTSLGVGALTADGIRLDGAKQTVAVAAVGLKGLRLKSWNDASKTPLLNMLAMASTAGGPAARPNPAAGVPAAGAPAAAPNTVPGTPPAPNAAASTAPTASPPAAESAWRVEVAAVTVDDSEVRWRAAQLEAPELVVAPLTAKVSNLHWPEAAPATLELNATVNDKTTLQASGTLTPANLDGELKGELKGLPLTWGNRLLAEQLTAKLAGGTLDANWQLRLAKGQPAQLQADGDIDGFELQRMPKERRLLAWNKLRWQELTVDLTKQQVKVAQVSLAAPWLMFRINADGTTNFSELVRHPATPAPGTAQPAPAAKPEPAPKPAEAAPAQADWQVLVERVRLDDGRLDFRDVSMPLPFRAVIGDFGGVVVGLSSDRGKAARVDLSGTVDGYAPVTLTGTASPLSEPPALDLALDFNNIDLATLTPYSGTYAGYAIDHGQLTVQLAYTLENNRIKGRNRVVVDQLVLGEKIESPKAVDLPLRLAIALLTDENGVMDLGVDITGNLDDPQFDLGGIIWKAFRNVIVKAATAPFRLLAGLVGGGKEKLGEVDFAPGSSDVDEPARQRLVKLKEALDKRPALRLALSGHIDPNRDAEALRLHLLNEQLQEDGVSAEDIEGQSRRWRNAIEDLYEERFPDRDTGDKTPQDLLPEVVASMELKPARLDALASQRALAAKRVLVVDLGMAPERVFISGDSGGKKNKVEKAQVTMGIDGR